MSPSPFDILQLPQRYDLDPNAIQQAGLRAMATHHPDRFTDPVQRAAAESKSAQINRAMRLLSNDESRANILLKLLGGPDKEQDQSLPDDFLMDMLETRQNMEQALASQDEEELKSCETWAEQQRTEYRSQIANLFNQIISKKTNDDQRTQIRTLLNAWRYIERMIEQLHEPQ